MVRRGAAVCVVFLLAGGQDLAGQERVSLSLGEALARVEEASEDVAIARAGVQRGRGEQLRARSQYYPQLSATLSYSRTLASEFEGVFGGGEWDTTTQSPGDTASGGIDFSDLPFGRENIWQAGLQFSQSLFAGGRIRAQNRIADASRAAAGITLETVRAETLLEVASAYFDAALSERLLAIAEATLAQSEETLRQTRIARDVGQQPEFDLLRAQVQRDNQVPVVIQQRAQRDLAVLRLKQLLEIPQQTELALTTPLAESVLLPDAVEEAGSVPAPVERAPVRQAAQSVAIQEGTLDVAEAQRFPSISLTSNYTRVNYPRRVAPEFDDFRTNWTVGVNLQLPLFTGGRIRGDEVVAASELASARAWLRQVVELAELDTRSALQQLAAAEASWRASAGTVEQAERAYAIAELRYEEGVSTQLELSDARILLQQAQATRASAARELQVSRIRVALLEDLPLGTPTAPGSMATPLPAGRGAGSPAAGSLPAVTQQPGSAQGGGMGAGGPGGGGTQ